MKALVKKNAESGLWLEEVPEPEVGLTDVLIKIHKASICGTDVHIYNWDPWSQKHVPVPMVIGHEFAGTVEAVGDLVKDFYPSRGFEQIAANDGPIQFQSNLDKLPTDYADYLQVEER